MLQEMIKELGTELVLLNGRKEYPSITQVFNEILKGNEISTNLRKLNGLLETFNSTTYFELDVIKNSLLKINEILEYISSKYNV